VGKPERIAVVNSLRRQKVSRIASSTLSHDTTFQTTSNEPTLDFDRDLVARYHAE
jgi:hypothetical protein